MKKLLCILLAVVLCFAALPISAFAEGENIVVSATPSKTAVNVGETFTVDFKLTKNTGFNTLGLQVEYDSNVLEIVCPNHKAVSENCDGVVTNKLGAQGGVGNNGVDSQYHTDNPYVIQWAYGTLKKDVTYTGRIATLTFKAKKAVAGCTTAIKVNVDQASNYANGKISFVGGSTNVAVHNVTTASTTVKKATTSANGSITRKCATSTCGKVISTTTIYYPKTVTLSATSYTYDGKVKTPTVTVKNAAGKVLKKNTDYTVTYATGRKNVGTYKVTVKFEGNYTGTKPLSFKIKPIDVSKCKISLSKTSYTYNGKAQKPSVTVKNASGTKLTTSSYTVTYAKGLKNVGIYKVTIKMKGNYTGTKTASFVINPPKTSLTSVVAGSKRFTAKWTKKSKQVVTGYQIQYATSSSFKRAKTVNVTSYKTVSKLVKSLKGKTRYYVRVRTYKTVGKTKYYSSWSTYKKVTTKK